MGCISFGLPIYDSDLGRIFIFGDCLLWNLYALLRNSCNLSEHHEFHHFTGSMEFVAAHFLRGGFAELKLGSLIYMVHAHEKNPVSATIQFF